MSASGRDLNSSLLRSRLDQFQGQLDRIEGDMTRVEDRISGHSVYASKLEVRLAALEQWRIDFEKNQADESASEQWGVGTIIAVAAIVVAVAGVIIAYAMR